jgi:hypothetical protein
MARPRKLPDVAAQLLSFVRAGNSPYASARAVGLGKSAWYEILRRGREGSDPQYAAFVEELEAARANAKVSLLTIVRAATPPTPCSGPRIGNTPSVSAPGPSASRRGSAPRRATARGARDRAPMTRPAPR